MSNYHQARVLTQGDTHKHIQTHTYRHIHTYRHKYILTAPYTQTQYTHTHLRRSEFTTSTTVLHTWTWPATSHVMILVSEALFAYEHSLIGSFCNAQTHLHVWM
jgi:hypothetical protein